jgi:molecular chaperone DnaK
MEIPFGIDLGTTHSCIAWVDNAGKPIVVRNVIGEETTPSVVYFEHPEKVTVGEDAKNSAILAPHLIAQLTKRLMGRSEVAGCYHGKTYSPEEVGALVLRELARSAQAATGRTVRDVVITVPAYFGVAEKAAICRAGKIAGLTVLDVLDEPVAAAFYYQSVRSFDRPRNVLVCDLGGGTFDTTVIRMDGDNVKVLCKGGDPRLGGADWDQRIVDYLLSEFGEANPGLDPSRDEIFQQDLVKQAEQHKKTLSSTQSMRCTLRFGSAAVKVGLTRAKLEELTADLLDRVVEVTRSTVETANAKGVESFDEVLLVGGMSKMPAIVRLLSERLGLRAEHHEPDLAVAKGAALYALLDRVRSGGSAGAVADQLGIAVEEVAALASKKVTTTVPRGFGVMAVDPRDPSALSDPLHAKKMIVHLLPAGTQLPADSGPYPFGTAIKNQRMVEIEVWEQTSDRESDDLAHNTRIGRGLMRGLPAGPPGTMFDVTFFLSETGLLTVRAEEPSSGAKISFDLQIGAMDTASLDAATAAIARHDLYG